MQARSYEKQAQSSLSAARIVWANEGLAGFYRGFGITIMREVCSC
jgi:solute carrier family 25 S-adenosylmethionine transporter 26